jgi:hypothetical protein
MTRKEFRAFAGRGLCAFGLGIARFFCLLGAAIVVVFLVMTSRSWLYSPWFWESLELAAVVATVSYGVFKRPRLEAAGRPVSAARVITLRSALNAAGVAALWFLVLQLDSHSQDLPFWLLIPMFLIPGLFIGWGLESARVETILFTPRDWGRLRHDWPDILAKLRSDFGGAAIIPLVSALYWVCAVSAFVAAEICLLPWHRLPAWIVWAAGWLGGGIFGFFMADAFVRLPRIRPLFDAAEINGATGARLSAEDVFIPYTIAVFLGGTLFTVIEKARHHNGLPLLTPPHWFILLLAWLPIVLGLLMAITNWLSRDPGEAERERRSEEEAYRKAYQEALSANDRVRQSLAACAEAAVAAWSEDRAAGRDESVAVRHLGEQLERGVHGHGIACALPGGEGLLAEQDFLLRLDMAAQEGALNVPEDRPFWDRRRPKILSWAEAVDAASVVATRLRAGHDPDDPRLRHLLGFHPHKEGALTAIIAMAMALLRPVTLALLTLVVLTAPAWGIDLLCFFGRTLADVTGLSRRFDRDTLTGLGVALIEVPIFTALIVFALKENRESKKEQKRR